MRDRIEETKLFFENPNWYLSKRSYYVRVRSDVVQELLKGSKFDSILDIGCGDGSMSVPLLNKSNHLTLLDLSENMLTVAKRRVPETLKSRLDTLNGDFMKVQLPVNGYDLIICLGVLSYVDSAEKFLEKIQSVMRPGGTLIIECTDGTHFLSRFMRAFNSLVDTLRGKQTEVALKVHSAEDIAAKLRELRFGLLTTYRYGAPLPVFRKLFTQGFHHRKIRAIFGGGENNRMKWLGNECLFQLKKTT